MRVRFAPQLHSDAADIARLPRLRGASLSNGLVTSTLAIATIAAPSLFERLLGARFAELPVVLQHFFCRGHRRASGTFDVERGPGALGRFVAHLLRLPHSARDIPLALDIARVGEGERWTRTFGCTEQLRSTKACINGSLVERRGATTVTFAVETSERGMHFRSTRVALVGLPLPRAIAPRLRADVVALDGAWRAEIEIAAPIVGRILRFGGIVRPTL